MVKLLKSRRILSVKEKLNILLCVYGSLTDFSVQQNGYWRVGRRLDIKPTTVQSVMTTLKKYNYDVERLVGKRRRPDKKRKLVGSQELEQYLVSKECLTKHAHFTLRQRAALIEKDYEVLVTPKRLTHMYKAHEVKYKFTKKTFSSARHPPDVLQEKRKAYAARLQAILDDG